MPRLTSQTLTPFLDHFCWLNSSTTFQLFSPCRSGSRTAVPSSGSRIESPRKRCQLAWCRDAGLSLAASACLPLPWDGTTSALIPCHTYLDSPQCCPLEDIQPIHLPTLISPVLLALLRSRPADSLMTGTTNCVWDHLPVCPPLQCFLWLLYLDWNRLVTGTKGREKKYSCGKK